MAPLLGLGPAAHGRGPLAFLARSCCNRASCIDLSEPDGVVHIRALARLVSIARNFMAPTSNHKMGIWVGRALSTLIVVCAIVLGFVVVYHTNRYPRTDDCEVFANFIGIAPQVEGPLVHLNVHDNQLVKKGDLLFEIDDRPYRYALEKAISEQATLEGQISDERRRIAALVSNVSVAEANIRTTETDVDRWAAAVDQARADVVTAEEGVSRARAEWMYASNNLHR